MKKLVRMLIVITFFSHTVYADISKEKLYTYLDISQGGAMFLSYHFDTLLKFSKKGYDKKSLKKMASDDKYLNLYTSEFVKLNDTYYNKIIEFYKTNVGKKYAKVIYDMAKINKNRFKELYKQNKCADDKQILIGKISKELNLINLKMASAKKSFYAINAIQPNHLKKSIYEMEIYESTYKSKLIQREKMISCIMYKNFTLKELKEVYMYASSEIGKHEAKLMYEGFGEYIKVFLQDIKTLEI